MIDLGKAVCDELRVGTYSAVVVRPLIFSVFDQVLDELAVQVGRIRRPEG